MTLTINPPLRTGRDSIPPNLLSDGDSDIAATILNNSKLLPKSAVILFRWKKLFIIPLTEGVKCVIPLTKAQSTITRCFQHYGMVNKVAQAKPLITESYSHWSAWHPEQLLAHNHSLLLFRFYPHGSILPRCTLDPDQGHEMRLRVYPSFKIQILPSQRSTKIYCRRWVLASRLCTHWRHPRNFARRPPVSASHYWRSFGSALRHLVSVC